MHVPGHCNKDFFLLQEVEIKKGVEMVFFYRLRTLLDRLWSVVPLIYRVVLGVAFFMAGLNKFMDLDKAAASFAALNLSIPTAQASLVAFFELVCGAALFVGLFTRLATLPLIFIMAVAVRAAYCPAGFAVCNPGYEVPFLYSLLLLTLLFKGPGVVSVDRMLFRK